MNAKTSFDDLRELIDLFTRQRVAPGDQNVLVPLSLLLRLVNNPPEGARSKSIGFLERLLSDLRDGKTMAYLCVRMEHDGEASGTHGFDGRFEAGKLDRFEVAIAYFASMVAARIKNLKKRS